MKSYWKRFSLYDKGITIFFMINLFLDVINQKVLHSSIPSEIVGYLFWLSLGLVLGFKLCKYEYSRTLRKYSELKP
ncbi:hypothetical protein DJ568_09765 [Mucilaginibacter hurinus]|uniref:Uncharacterized protein n=1 Tax=Mucilaginibacter hurinus TaxID=2201324 RepID=A0A367GMR5_9SPHI|nr:hypothetical protein DJ568_09765 [Mucilaginibacter hurinus]